MLSLTVRATNIGIIFYPRKGWDKLFSFLEALTEKPCQEVQQPIRFDNPAAFGAVDGHFGDGGVIFHVGRQETVPAAGAGYSFKSS